jgi:hypothetical protein
MTLKYPETVGKEYRKSPTGRTLWCGPFAVAVLTGVSYDDAHAEAVRIERRRLNAEAKRVGLKPGYWNKTHFKGMHFNALKRTAEKLGAKFGATTFTYNKAKALTLLTFARDHTVAGKVYLITAGNHYVIVKDGVLYHSHHDPLPVEQAPRYKMAKVTKWTEVRPAY